jgi:nucleoside-diphosphate-sugar epimerase
MLMNHTFAAIVLGGTGQVGGAAVEELLAIPECREVVMVTRKPIAAQSRVRNVVLDTAAADFAERTAAVAREVLGQGSASAVRHSARDAHGLFNNGVICRVNAEGCPAKRHSPLCATLCKRKFV